MKKIIIYSVLCLLLGGNLYCQWIDKGEYKEFQASKNSISKLIANPEDDYFIIIDSSNNLYHYDYNTLLLEEKNNIPPVYIINDDGKSYTSSFVFSYLDGVVGKGNVYQAITKNLINDSLIFNHYFSGETYDFNYSRRISRSFSLKYNFKSQKSIALVSESQQSQLGFFDQINYFSSFGSGVLIYSLNDGKVLSYPGGLIESYDNKFEHIASVSFSDNSTETISKIGNPTITTGQQFRGFYFTNLNNNKSILLSGEITDHENYKNNTTGIIPQNFLFGNFTNSLHAFKDNIIYKYNFTEDTIILIEKFSFNPKPNNLIFSKFDNFYILSYSDNSISIYKSDDKKFFKSYRLLDSSIINTIVNTQDGTGILCSCSNGTVKLFQPEFLSKSLKSFFISDIQTIVENDTVSFFSYSGGDPTTWHWDFGDGTTSYLKNPKHIYFNSGIYTVSLVVIDGTNSDTMIRTNYIKVVPPIIANFTSDQIKVGEGGIINFKDISDGNVYSWKWYFGDGDSSIVKNPSHKYNIPGKFTVRLIVNDGINYDSIVKINYITILNKPIPNYTIFNNIGRIPLVTNFKDESIGEIKSWEWHLGNKVMTLNKSTSFQDTFLIPDIYSTYLSISDNASRPYYVNPNYVIAMPDSLNFDYNYDIVYSFIPIRDETQNATGDNVNYTKQIKWELIKPIINQQGKLFIYLNKSDLDYQWYWNNSPNVYKNYLNYTWNGYLISINSYGFENILNHVQTFTQIGNINYDLSNKDRGNILLDSYSNKNIALLQRQYGTFHFIISDSSSHILKHIDTIIGGNYYLNNFLVNHQNKIFAWGDNSTNNILVKIDSSFTKLIDTVLINNSSFNPIFNYKSIILKNNKLAIVGYAKTNVLSYLTYFDADGNLLAQKTIDQRIKISQYEQILECANQQLLIIGNDTKYSYCYRIDTLGNMIWSKKSELNTKYKGIAERQSGTISICGQRGDFIFIDYMDKNGNLLDSNTFMTRKGILQYVLKTNDNCLFFTGIVRMGNDTNQKVFYLKTNSENLNSIDESLEALNTNIQFYPNPVNDILTISGNFDKSERIVIYSMLGEHLINTSSSNNIDVSSLATGTYFMKIGSQVLKFIKLK